MGVSKHSLVSADLRGYIKGTMSSDPNAQMDQTVLDLIENSPTGAVPHTPTYQDTLRRLHAAHQVYSSADYKDGHVTVRSLAAKPSFLAANLAALRSGEISPDALEPDADIFDRYMASLPAELRERAETFRAHCVARSIHHRKHAGTDNEPAIHDPVRSLFLVPGTGPRLGLPGNYLRGALVEHVTPGEPSRWTVSLHDAEDDTASGAPLELTAALDQVEEVVASAPFELGELEALGFKVG